MSVFNKLVSFSFDKNRNKIFGIKSGIVWGRSKKGGSSPILYISKPKHISQEDYEELLDHLNLYFSKA